MLTLAGAVMLGLMFTALVVPAYQLPDNQPDQIRKMTASPYPAPVTNFPPPVTALSLAPTQSTDLAQVPVEILDLPRPGQELARPVNSALQIEPLQQSGEERLNEWTSRAGRTVNPVAPGPVLQGDLPLAPQIPALTPGGLIQPNTYFTGDPGNPDSIVLADELAVHSDPRGDAPVAGPPLKYLERIRPDARIRSETDFDWMRLPPSDVYPAGGWIRAEYLAPIAKIAAAPQNAPSFVIGSEPVDREIALPLDYKPHDLVTLPSQICLPGKEVQVRENTALAIQALISKAQESKIQLRVLSGYRPFDHQRRLYLEAISKRGPKQDGTAQPGHSEHQLGTTVDFCGPDIRTHLNGRFAQTAEGRFLQEHAPAFGFRNSYTAENSEESGFKPEPWHWRQVEPFQHGANP